MKIKPPATFQGAKQRLAPAIVDAMAPRSDEPFSDLCCGSGAVTIEVASRGVPASLLGMVDDGPWGLVWEEVGAGRFSLDALRRVAAAVPDRVELQVDFLRELRQQPAHVDTSAVFLILQAGSFGGIGIFINNDRWIDRGFRTAWVSKSDPQKRTGTMMPCADAVARRMDVLCDLLLGVAVDRGNFCDIVDLEGTVYVDPPYVGTSGYGGQTVPVYEFAAFAARSPGARVWVSEARPLVGDTRRMSVGRRQGGIKGGRNNANEEWLTMIQPRCDNSLAQVGTYEVREGLRLGVEQGAT